MVNFKCSPVRKGQVMEEIVTPKETQYTGRITVDVEGFNYLLGKLLTQAEILGLSPSQEKAYKSTLKQIAWDWYNGWIDNPHGFADPSHQARVQAGIEPRITSSFLNNS